MSAEFLLLSRLRQMLASKFKYLPLALRFECLSSPFKLDTFFDTDFLKNVNLRAHELDKLSSLKANESVASTCRSAINMLKDREKGSGSSSAGRGGFPSGRGSSANRGGNRGRGRGGRGGGPSPNKASDGLWPFNVNKDKPKNPRGRGKSNPFKRKATGGNSNDSKRQKPF